MSRISDVKRILFLPLSNVLGHLARTLALAEEFDAQGHEVFVATDRSYAFVEAALPPTITLVTTPGLPRSWTQSFGQIRHFEASAANDLENLREANLMDDTDRRQRRERWAEMARSDAEIVARHRPDVIIVDYRFTVDLFERPPRQVFHISHILGFPSLHRRVKGEYPFPFETSQILVPGIREIEYSDPGPSASSPWPSEHVCGPLRWDGWRRLAGDARPPPPADVFVFFGSTGGYEQIVPRLLETIPARYRVSGIAPGLPRPVTRERALVREHGELERFLERADVAFCHGGHGTVMECIRCATPMAVFPRNIEQLEIGRRIESLGLGLLVEGPHEELSEEDLEKIIERLRSDANMRRALESYAELLREHDGPRTAVSTVLAHLAPGV